MILLYNYLTQKETKLGSLYFKTMQSFDLNKHILNHLMEGKLSIGPFSPSAISFNDNAIERNFYPKKFFAFFKAFQRFAANLKEIFI